MDDPYIVAFRVLNPFKPMQYGMRPALFYVWHKDPRTPGHLDPGSNGDVAGWAWPRLNASEIAYAEHLAGKDNDIDNLNAFFPGAEYETRLSRIKQLFRLHKGHTRPWWRHPRWHFWNWRLSPT